MIDRSRSLSRSPRAQRGVALVVGLILLAVMTLIGVTGMSGSILELAMAANSQQTQYAFNAAESSINAEIANGAPLVVSDGLLLDDPVRPVANYQYRPVNNVIVAAAVTTSYQGQLDCPSGFELDGQIGGAISVDCVHFASRSSAAAGRGATSRQRAEFFIPAPAP